MIVYRICVEPDSCPYIAGSVKEALDFLEVDLSETAPGAVIQIQVTEMAQEDFDQLPEWAGP